MMNNLRKILKRIIINNKIRKKLNLKINFFHKFIQFINQIEKNR